MIAFLDPEEQLRHLDFSDVRFPSDNLSLAVLRKVHSDLFDLGFDLGNEGQPKFFLSADHGGHAKAILGNMLYCERVVAANAFAATRGIELLDGEFNISDFKDELTRLYTRYGIASGTHQAAELIRDIETQGSRLGRQKSK